MQNCNMFRAMSEIVGSLSHSQAKIRLMYIYKNDAQASNSNIIFF